MHGRDDTKHHEHEGLSLSPISFKDLDLDVMATSTPTNLPIGEPQSVARPEHLADLMYIEK